MNFELHFIWKLYHNNIGVFQHCGDNILHNNPNSSRWLITEQKLVFFLLTSILRDVSSLWSVALRSDNFVVNSSNSVSLFLHCVTTTFFSLISFSRSSQWLSYWLRFSFSLKLYKNIDSPQALSAMDWSTLIRGKY